MPKAMSSPGFTCEVQEFTGFGEMYMFIAPTPLERVDSTNERKDNMGVYRRMDCCLYMFCINRPSTRTSPHDLNTILTSTTSEL